MSALHKESASEKFNVLKGKGNKKATIALIVALGTLLIVVAGVSTYNTVVQYQSSNENNQNMEEISKSLEEMYGGLNSVHTIVTDNRTTLGQGDGSKDVVSQLDTLDSNITSTQSDILALKQYIDEGGTLSQEEYQNVINQYSNIESNINSINNDLTKTINNIDSEISNLKASNSADYKNIISNLSDTKKSLTTANTQIMSSVTSQMTAMQTELGSDIKTMEKNVTSSLSDTKEKISKDMESNQSELKTMITTNNQQLTTQVSANHAALVDKINELDTHTSEGINQVFQSASSGKNAIVAAINATNAAAGASSDMSFAAINNAIIDLPIDLKYDAGGSFGILNADYVKFYTHVHTHEDGTQDTRDIVFASSNPGGCYQALPVHIPNMFMSDEALAAAGLERDTISVVKNEDTGAYELQVSWIDEEGNEIPNCYVAMCKNAGGSASMDSPEMYCGGSLTKAEAEFTYSTSGKHQEYGMISDYGD